jgi:catechol 2,3-dioxygenase-like lactoylglutathione lyase family enzyme
LSERIGVTGIVESSLYVEDLDRSEEFYSELFGFDRMVGDDRLRAMAVGPGQVLLLFLRGASNGAMETAGGTIPPHNGRGRLHLAFGIAPAAVEGWIARLRDAGIAIESRVRWEAGGESVYFRDPDGHAVELVTPGCWPNW